MRVAFLTYFSQAFQVIRMRLRLIRFAYVLASVLLSCYTCMCVLLSYSVSCICVIATPVCVVCFIFPVSCICVSAYACMRVLLNFFRFMHFVSVTPVCVFLLNHSRLRTFPRFLPPYRVVSVAFIDVNLICKSGLSRMARLGSHCIVT